MSFRPPVGDVPTPEEPIPGELRLWARIEDLVGEEHRLMSIAGRDRAQHEHDRLREIGHELDRIFETLKQRAERHAGGRTATSKR
jgi:hypothetical protein